MSDAEEFAEGTRVVTAERYDYVDHMVEPGDEGIVMGYTTHDGYDVCVEWDRGFVGSAHSGDLTVVPNKEEEEL